MSSSLLSQSDEDITKFVEELFKRLENNERKIEAQNAEIESLNFLIEVFRKKNDSYVKFNGIKEK